MTSHAMHQHFRRADARMRLALQSEALVAAIEEAKAKKAEPAETS